MIRLRYSYHTLIVTAVLLLIAVAGACAQSVSVDSLTAAPAPFRTGRVAGWMRARTCVHRDELAPGTRGALSSLTDMIDVSATRRGAPERRLRQVDQIVQLRRSNPSRRKRCGRLQCRWPSDPLRRGS